MVIVDPWKAGADVGELVATLSKEVGAPIVVFTADGGARLLSEALKAGVKGYVRKDSPPEDLIRAIGAARAGDFYVDPSLSSTIVLEEGDRTLSARQRQILQMLADGRATEAVATELGLSTETVRTHTKRILAKLEASTRTQAVAIGLRYGLIEYRAGAAGSRVELPLPEGEVGALRIAGNRDLPSGTGIGPTMTSPPPSRTRARASSSPSTAK